MSNTDKSNSSYSNSSYSNTIPQIYQGQFGEFTITDSDRQGVIIYRTSLIIAALCFGIGVIAATFSSHINLDFMGSNLINPVISPVLAENETVPNSLVLNLLTVLYIGFTVALGIALANIHIYVKQLHQTLKIFLGIGSVSSLGLAAIAIQHNQPLAIYIYHNPLTILGVGFTFAALTGIYFKEAFCFNRLETKFLVAIAPILLCGHLLGILSMEVERILLIAWAIFFAIFALRKAFQVIPADIGDKSVFAYLEEAELEKAKLKTS
jgi:uncharacterized integral membrane protein